MNASIASCQQFAKRLKWKANGRGRKGAKGAMTQLVIGATKGRKGHIRRALLCHDLETDHKGLKGVMANISSENRQS